MPASVPKQLQRQSLKIKILLPMTLGLVVFLGLYTLSTSWYLDREIERNLNRKITEFNLDYQLLLEQRSNIMLAELKHLAQLPQLQQLMRQRDRSALLAAAKPEFDRMSEILHFSHFYFLRPDLRVFLRVHKPERYDDLITRHTLQQAAQTQQPSSGIELGYLGTFTLRTVLPWYQGDTLLGYLELGEEIELLLDNFFRQKELLITTTIDKRFLNRKSWEAGTKMLGKHSFDWDLLPDKVVTQTSKPELLPKLTTALLNQPRGDNKIKLSTEKNQYQGLIQPLIDASGQQIGEFLILYDVTVTVDEYWKIVFAFTALCIIPAGGLLLSTSIMLGRLEKQQKETDRQLHDEMLKVHNSNIQLEKEIEDRKEVENELNRVQGDLEERVNERTEQLWLSLEQTQQIRKQLTDIVTSVPDGLIVTDLEKNILLVNLRAEELFQCSLADCVQKPLSAIIRDPAMAQKMEDALQQQLNDLRFDVMQISSDLQSSISLQVRTSILTDRQGKTIGMIFLIHDISKEREIERMKSEFITTAVHELSTPLTAVIGYSEYLLQNPHFAEPERQEFLSIIHEKADFLGGLVEDLLDISRIESGKPLSLQKALYPATELFERPIQHLQHLSSSHRFSIELAAADTQLLVDKEKIWQVMENLCSNAVKYSPAGGEIRITGQLNDTNYRINITDQGVGLTPDQIARVFEKFYRGNQSDTAIGGTGLGLTIVKHIIESHQGQIWIDSELGQGTVVHFILPIHRKQAAAD